MHPDSSELAKPLEKGDWDRLGAILASLGDRAELDVEGLDGLVAANACGPRQMRPMTVSDDGTCDCVRGWRDARVRHPR